MGNRRLSQFSISVLLQQTLWIAGLIGAMRRLVTLSPYESSYFELQFLLTAVAFCMGAIVGTFRGTGLPWGAIAAVVSILPALGQAMIDLWINR